MTEQLEQQKVELDKKKAAKPSTPRCKDGTLDMRHPQNRGLNKYTGLPVEPIPGKHDGPRCIDGSLDMRCP